MGNNKPHDGRTMGIVFTVVSLLLIFTSVGPALFVIPGYALKNLARLLINGGFFHGDYNKLTTVLLTVTLLIVMVIFLLVIRNTVIKTGQFSRGWITIFFVILSFLIHSLGDYTYSWAIYDFENREDLATLLPESFPYTSFAFIPIGLLFDAIIHKYTDLFKHYK